MINQRYTLPLTTLLMISVAPHALADDFDVASKIDTVTVYRAGAGITRTASLNLPAGNHNIILKGLTSELDADNIRANFAKRGVAIRQIKVKQVHSTAVSDERRNKILAEIEALQAKNTILRDQAQTANLQLTYVARLSPPTNKDKEQSLVSSADLESILQFIGKNGNSLKDTIRQSNAAQKLNKKEISRLSRELGTANNDLFSYDITIKAYARTAQRADLTLSYRVDDAEWGLHYDADLDSETDTLSLTQYAQVIQDTGENWNGAAITLSTKEPDLDSDAPTLYPQFVDVIEPRVISSRLRRSDAQVLKEAPSAAPEPAMVVEEMIVTGTKFTNTDFSTSFELASGTVINSSPDEQSFELMSHAQKVTLKAVAIPQEAESAFLYADLTYDGDTPLYSGSMELFRNGTYAGEASFSTILSGQDASLAMGQDSKVIVKHVDEGENKSENGIFNKDTEKLYRLTYRVENHHSRNMPIEIRANRPVSVNEKLEVEALRASTNATITDWEDNKGVLAWSKTLKPGEHWTVKNHYKLTFPKGMTVVPRR